MAAHRVGSPNVDLMVEGMDRPRWKVARYEGEIAEQNKRATWDGLNSLVHQSLAQAV